ncbi:hypothetical protein [Paraflavitalea speifideaquila]|uniref:hypothetical protein n=1 Tax=Paraflavitalea speifideaquila TaxID=3076558 RepID=UPI0028E43533|nr:hypothetical protein [Paraflavitalea speifideiaquila]
MYSKLLAAFLLLISINYILTTGCKKNNHSPNPTPIDTTSNTLRSNALLVDSTALAQVTETQVVLTLSKLTTKPAIGSILLAPPSALNQYGFIRKVTQVTESAGQLVCLTEPAGLNEAFEQLSFNINYQDSFSVAYGRTGSSISYTISNKEILDGLVLNGVIKVNIPKVTINYKKKQGSLKPEHILLQADINTEGSGLEITNTKSTAITLLKVDTLKTILLPTIAVTIPIITPIAVIPFPLVLTQKVHLTVLPLTASGKLKLRVSPVVRVTVGAQYQDGQWTNISHTTMDPLNQSPFCKKDFFINGSLDASLTLFKPIYEIAPYNNTLLKGFFEIPATLSFQAQTNSPNYSLKFGLGIEGGLEQKFWEGASQRLSLSVNLIEKEIARGDWTCQDTLPTVSTAAATLIKATTASIGGTVSNDGGAAVTSRGICYSKNQQPTIANDKTTNGKDTGTFQAGLTALQPNTTYYARAYATNSVGTAYGNQVTFTTAKNWPLAICMQVASFTTSTIRANMAWFAHPKTSMPVSNGTMAFLWRSALEQQI